MPRFDLLAACAALAAAAPVLASVTINFDDVPPAAWLSRDFYADRGVLISLDGAMGPTGEGTLTVLQAPAGLPAPASGLGLIPYGSLAGFMDDFVFDFTTPITSFSLHAFDGAQAVRALGYRDGVLVGEFSAPAQPGRVSLELTLGSAGGITTYDRVVIDLSRGHGSGDPDEGPRFYDVLTFTQVPAPATLVLLAGGVIAAGRRKR